MVEYHITEDAIEVQEKGKDQEQISLFSIERTDVMTGDRNRSRYLLYQLKISMSQAKQIDIIVSFLMESGVRMILHDLKNALDRGVKVRLLTGNYLGITQPSALYLIKSELGERIDLRFYNEQARSFHPKAYIFHGEKDSEIYVGSSNLSRSALTSGIEWNYRFSSRTDRKNFDVFLETFEDLFDNHSVIIDDEELKKYSKNWKKPAVSKDIDRYEQVGENNSIRDLIYPRGVQIEALYALNASRGEGATKGLVQAATGVGKTYLAAFDSQNYEHVLFVAHREEILRQAAVSFRNVRQSEDYGFFNGKQKETDKSVIFASVSSLGKLEYLNINYFRPDYFDYIVIDEFHHAVTQDYQRIIAYFRPKFLLGLTATPDRMDGRNIYEICDYNVPFEISLKDAIQKGILVPFHYYGIYDETDYSGLHLVRGNYTEKDLNAAYIGNQKRHELIYKHYRKYQSKRALGFCCSRAHAEEMVAYFSERGIPAVAVYSNADGANSEERGAALEKLKKGEIRVIFSVDMFNEGVDIPSMDMVMFLRPTESQVVFLQQLGRGLRKERHKEFLNVLDFIGNYEKAGLAPYLLSGQIYSREHAAQGLEQVFEYPDDCIVDFDMRLIDLFQKIASRELRISERIQLEYERVKEMLDGKVPTRMELFTYMEDEIYQLCMRTPKENPFRNYLEYLNQRDDLSDEEMEIYSGIGREFLHVIETTNMQKSYKMPVLLAFYHDGDIRMAVTEQDLLAAWKDFFESETNWKDLEEGITYAEYQKITDRQHLGNIKRNPVKYLRSSGEGFFVEREGCVLALREELQEAIKKDPFRQHMKDIIDYRTMEYYRRRYEEKNNC